MDIEKKAEILLVEWERLALINPSKSACEELKPKLVAAMMWAYKLDR